MAECLVMKVDVLERVVRKRICAEVGTSALNDVQVQAMYELDCKEAAEELRREAEALARESKVDG